MHLASLLDRRTTQSPNARAVSDATRSLSNVELLRWVSAVAEQLREHGIGRGDVVALRLTNRIEFVVLLFAAWRIGATVTPLNPSLTLGEVTRQLDDSYARLLIIEDETPAPHATVLTVSELRRSPQGPDVTPADDGAALALLIYTSGTTGTPKGVMLDHANLDAMVEMGRQALNVGPDDRCLLILPLFHVNGIVVSVLLPLVTGASVAIADRFKPQTFFDILAAERPTFFSAVPTIYNMLLSLPTEVVPDTASVRFAICGAAPAAAELLSRFERRYGFPLLEAYGLSEATCGSTINPLRGPRRVGTVGIPLPGQDLRILTTDGSEAKSGVDGEVVVRGGNVMRGYLGRPEETAKVLVDGWLRTGDVGHLDAEGYLTLVGRSKDMIIRGGENIYPKEIEDVLSSHPSVREAAVIGVPDAVWGEVVVAYVESSPGQSVDTEALMRHCAGHLAGYKRPIAIYALEALPRNAVGKVAKADLRQAHADHITSTGAQS
jgi:long-chain acyl-CoA synthetase